MGKKNRTITTTTTSVQDRRIGATDDAVIAAEGSFVDRSDNRRFSETRNFDDRSVANSNNTTTFELVDSETSQASVEALRDTSADAIRATGDAALALFDRSAGIVDDALSLAGASAAGAQSTAGAALAKTASEGNQAIESVTRAAILIAGAFFVSQIFRS